MTDIPENSIIISNGLKNFPMTATAAEIDKRNLLNAFICGFYPKEGVKALIGRLSLLKMRRMQKLLGRAVAIRDSQIRMCVLADIFDEMSSVTRRFLPAPYQDEFRAFAMRRFAGRAGRVIRGSKGMPTVYHYRSGFGLTSLKEARAKGMVLLCEHTIAHPLMLNSLIDKPDGSAGPVRYADLDPIWRQVQDDIRAADHIIVNSDFVKTTFALSGERTAPVTVIYRGIDDVFLQAIPARKPRAPGTPLRFLFAGRFGPRKGAADLLAAIRQLPQGRWALDVAGTVDPALSAGLNTALQGGAVRLLGNMTRTQLAAAMTEADVFVFPSLAEGSARVILEALACGCSIITTYNSGSIVEDGVHGRLVPAADPERLAAAMVSAIEDPAISDQGARNSALIRSKMTQSDYGERVVALYSQLIQDSTKS